MDTKSIKFRGAKEILMFRDERYKEAMYQVKINHFTEQGFDINGVIHVGTNDGYELQWYQMMGIEWFIGFDPLPSAIKEFHRKYHVDFDHVIHLPFALGDVEADLFPLQVTSGDGQGSSFLDVTDKYFEEHPEYTTEDRVICPVFRFDYLAKKHAFDMSKYDCLVVDTQGTELEVLKGFGKLLKGFKYLNIECSSEPVYKGSASGYEIAEYLDAWGFDQDSPMEVHNDVFFIKRGLK